jgi:hypothetical protein
MPVALVRVMAMMSRWADEDFTGLAFAVTIYFRAEATRRVMKKDAERKSG